MKLFLIAPALAFTASATAAPIKQLLPPWQFTHDKSSVDMLNHRWGMRTHQPAYPSTHENCPQNHVRGQPPYRPPQPLARHQQRHVPGQPPHNPEHVLQQHQRSPSSLPAPPQAHEHAQQPPPLQNFQQLPYYEPCPEVLLHHQRCPSPLPGSDAPPHQRQHTVAKHAHLKAIKASWKAINHAAVAHEHRRGNRESWRYDMAAEKKAIMEGEKGYNIHKAAAKEPNPDPAWSRDPQAISKDVVRAKLRKRRAKAVIGRARRLGVNIM